MYPKYKTAILGIALSCSLSLFGGETLEQRGKESFEKVGEAERKAKELREKTNKVMTPEERRQSVKTEILRREVEKQKTAQADGVSSGKKQNPFEKAVKAGDSKSKEKKVTDGPSILGSSKKPSSAATREDVSDVSTEIKDKIRAEVNDEELRDTLYNSVDVLMKRVDDSIVERSEKDQSPLDIMAVQKARSNLLKAIETAKAISKQSQESERSSAVLAAGVGGVAGAVQLAAMESHGKGANGRAVEGTTGKTIDTSSKEFASNLMRYGNEEDAMAFNLLEAGSSPEVIKGLMRMSNFFEEARAEAFREILGIKTRADRDRWEKNNTDPELAKKVLERARELTAKKLSELSGLSPEDIAILCGKDMVSKIYGKVVAVAVATTSRCASNWMCRKGNR